MVANGGKSSPELERKFLEYSLNQQARAQQIFGRDVKLSALLLALLLVFFFQYLRLAAEETALDEAYGNEVESLTNLLNQLERVDALLTEQDEKWAVLAKDHLALANAQVVEMGLHIEHLRGTSGEGGSGFVTPAFLAECSAFDDKAILSAPAGSEQEGLAIKSPVNACILEPMAKVVAQERETEFLLPLRGELDKLESALDEVIQTIQTRDIVGSPLDDADVLAFRRNIQRVRQTVERQWELTGLPTNQWWDTFAGPHDSFASFRDNLSFFLSARHAVGTLPPSAEASNLRSTGTGIAPPAIKSSMDDVRSSIQAVVKAQEDAREKMAKRTGGLDKMLPDYAQPLMAVARPKFMVLGYPIAVAGFAIYLMIAFAILQRRIRNLIQACNDRDNDVAPDVVSACVSELPLVAFAGLCLLPLLPASFTLFWIYRYDYQELADRAPDRLYVLTGVLYLLMAFLAWATVYTDWFEGLVPRRTPGQKLATDDSDSSSKQVSQSPGFLVIYIPPFWRRAKARS